MKKIPRQRLTPTTNCLLSSSSSSAYHGHHITLRFERVVMRDLNLSRYQLSVQLNNWQEDRLSVLWLSQSHHLLHHRHRHQLKSHSHHFALLSLFRGQSERISFKEAWWLFFIETSPLHTQYHVSFSLLSHFVSIVTVVRIREEEVSDGPLSLSLSALHYNVCRQRIFSFSSFGSQFLRRRERKQHRQIPLSK